MEKRDGNTQGRPLHLWCGYRSRAVQGQERLFRSGYLKSASASVTLGLEYDSSQAYKGSRYIPHIIHRDRETTRFWVVSTKLPQPSICSFVLKSLIPNRHCDHC